MFDDEGLVHCFIFERRRDCERGLLIPLGLREAMATVSACAYGWIEHCMGVVRRDLLFDSREIG